MFYQLHLEQLDPPVEGNAARGSFPAISEETFLGAETEDVVLDAPEVLFRLLYEVRVAGEPMPPTQPITTETLSYLAPIAWLV